MMPQPGVYQFPSLSGKTFIRTKMAFAPERALTERVSIPFREDLHSDKGIKKVTHVIHYESFHPFQGRPSFGQTVTPCLECDFFNPFPSLSGKTFIRTLKIHQFTPDADEVRFHPFQGRPSFGRIVLMRSWEDGHPVFPSLSGKTFIRTFHGNVVLLKLRF